MQPEAKKNILKGQSEALKWDFIGLFHPDSAKPAPERDPLKVILVPC